MRNMLRTIFGFVLLIFVAAASTVASTPTAAFLAQSDQHWGMLTTYCVACHNAKLKNGGIAFDQLDPAGVPEHAQTWEKVVRKLRGGMMPPPGMRRPAHAESDAFVAWMEGYLDAAAALNPNPGDVALHRLNRKEYANAVYDLLGLKLDASELLPAGRSERRLRQHRRRAANLARLLQSVRGCGAIGSRASGREARPAPWKPGVYRIPTRALKGSMSMACRSARAAVSRWNTSSRRTASTR